MKNVVFDFGQVLVRFDPAYMVGCYVKDRSDASLLEEVLFDRLYWDRLDAGTITDDEMMEAVRARIPERLWSVAQEVYVNWIYNIPEIEGMRDLILHIKKTYGVSVFLLSNISLYFAEHANEIPILALVDRCVLSAVCGRVKPDLDIYEYLCADCSIDPEDTIFIDDRIENVRGAERAGITGYLFDGNVAKLHTHLSTILSKQ